MKQLWAPWRIEYIEQHKPDHCIFCRGGGERNDGDNLVLYRGSTVFVMMNRYPYTNGHLLVSPYRHTAELGELSREEMLELVEVVSLCRDVLTGAMAPQGFNIGMNLGKAAGAGVEEHLHMHVVPRWTGDTSFMTIVDDVRVVPEALKETWRKLLPLFPAEREHR